MFAFKKFNTSQGIMLAACDAELLGKKPRFNDLEVEIRESFYFEDYCSKEELKELLKEVKIINLFGEKTKKAVIEINLARENDFKVIDKVPYIQIYRL